MRLWLCVEIINSAFCWSKRISHLEDMHIYLLNVYVKQPVSGGSEVPNIGVRVFVLCCNTHTLLFNLWMVLRGLYLCVHAWMAAQVCADLNKIGFSSKQIKSTEEKSVCLCLIGGSGLKIDLWFIIVVNPQWKWEVPTRFLAWNSSSGACTTLPALWMQNDWETTDEKHWTQTDC